MHIEARRMHVATARMAEIAARVLLVRALVLGEAHVAVDAEDRAAIRPGIADEVPGYLLEMRRNGAHEIAHRRLHRLAVSLLVVLEPGAVVVLLELAEEREEVPGHTGKRVSHASLPAPTVAPVAKPLQPGAYPVFVRPWRRAARWIRTTTRTRCLLTPKRKRWRRRTASSPTSIWADSRRSTAMPRRSRCSPARR